MNNRIEYDPYRYDYERVLAQNHTVGVTLLNPEEDIERRYQHFKECYQKCKTDIIVKLRLVDDNRVCNFISYCRYFNYKIFVDKSYATTAVDLVS